MSTVPPVCTNCGATDFVWVNDLKTGSIGGGTLSLRSRGELALGTRVCRSCGHADLFLKDPSILRMPHTWRPGEFVPIPAQAPPTSHAVGAPMPSGTSPGATSAALASSSTPAQVHPSPPSTPPPSSTPPPPAAPSPGAPPAPDSTGAGEGATAAAAAEVSPTTKRSARRRPAKSKSGGTGPPSST